MLIKKERTTQEKIAIFSGLFVGRKDVFYNHNPEINGLEIIVHQIKEIIITLVINKHIQ